MAKEHAIFGFQNLSVVMGEETFNIFPMVLC